MKQNCKFNRSGFASTSLILFIPLIGLFMFSTGFIGYLIQHKTKIRSICLTEGRRIQENLVRNQENILKLNTLVSALRLRLKLAQAELVAAYAAKNPAWIAKVQAEIAAIKSQQRQLDFVQQTLLKKAKSEAFLQTTSLQLQMNQINQKTENIWRLYLDIFALSVVDKNPEVALERDSPDVAPIYELSSDYINKQRLALNWQTRFKTKSNAQKILSSQNEINIQCDISAKKKGTEWNLLINGGKS